MAPTRHGRRAPARRRYSPGVPVVQHDWFRAHRPRSGAPADHTPAPATFSAVASAGLRCIASPPRPASVSAATSACASAGATSPQHAPSMLGALADGEHVGDRRSRIAVIDHDAAPDRQPGRRARGPRFRPDADRDRRPGHGRYHGARLLRQHRRSTRPAPSMATADCRAEHNLDPLLGQPAPATVREARVVELALHQPVHRVHHRDLHAAASQAGRRLQAQQPPADHDRGARRALRRLDHVTRTSSERAVGHAPPAGPRLSSGRRTGVRP